MSAAEIKDLQERVEMKGKLVELTKQVMTVARYLEHVTACLTPAQRRSVVERVEADPMIPDGQVYVEIGPPTTTAAPNPHNPHKPRKRRRTDAHWRDNAAAADMTPR